MYIRVEGREVMGLTDGERRSLHPDHLGRKPTMADVRRLLDGKMLGPVTHHINQRTTCNGCNTRVYDWAEEAKPDVSGWGVPTGRQFCRTCVRHRAGTAKPVSGGAARGGGRTDTRPLGASENCHPPTPASEV